MSPLRNAFDGLALDLTVQGANTRLESIAALLQGVIDTVGGLEDNSDVEAELALANVQLVEANAQLEALSTLTTNVIQGIDGSNTRLDVTNSYVNLTNERLDVSNATLAAIAGHVDTLEGLTDGLEALGAATNTELAAANATLTAIAGHVDQLEGFTDGIETLLTGIAASAESIDARLAAPLVVGEARVTSEARGRVGMHFVAGTGHLTLAAAGSLRGTLSNPADSGRYMHLYRLSISATAGPSFAKFLVNPTTGLPALAARPVNNVFMGHPNASQAILKADTSIAEGLGGGQDTGIELGIFAGFEEVELPPYIIPPGVTLALGIDFAGPVELSVTAHWWEE